MVFYSLPFSPSVKKTGGRFLSLKGDFYHRKREKTLTFEGENSHLYREKVITPKGENSHLYIKKSLPLLVFFAL